LRAMPGQVDADAPEPIGEGIDLWPPHRATHERAVDEDEGGGVLRPDRVPGRDRISLGHAAQPGCAPTSRRAPPIRIEVNGMRSSRNASIETRKPASKTTTATKLATANGPVTPNRFSVSPAEATKPPAAFGTAPGRGRADRPRNRQ